MARPSRLHTAKILRLSEDLPVAIEIVDSEDKINSFLPVLDTMTAAASAASAPSSLKLPGSP